VYAVNDVPYDVATGTTPPGNVFAYSVDASTGVLTAAPGSPFPAGTSPKAIAFDPGGNFAYVANYGSQNLSIYVIDRTTGALAAAGGPFDTKAGYPQSLTVDPSGQFVFITGLFAPAQSTDGFIEVCTIDANSGALGYVSNNNGVWLSGQSSVAVAAEPSGKFVYVVNNGSNDVSAYAVDAGTGTLTPVGGGPFAAGPGPISVITDPSGKFAFVLDAGSSPGQILTFSIGPTGALSQLPGGATTVGSGPVAIAVSW
jgi:6-phosphogluconolactonase